MSLKNGLPFCKFVKNTKELFEHAISRAMVLPAFSPCFISAKNEP